MKIQITKKVKISLDRKTFIPIFLIVLLIIGGLLIFFGYDVYQKTGTPETVTTKDAISIDKNQLDSTNEYKNLETPLDLSNGIGKSDPFRPN